MDYKEAQLYEKVEKALQAFFKKDGQLLHINANERSISHKVAEHLQDQFSDLNVDCEYNRRGDQIKKRLDDIQRVFPDIVVHKRGTDSNNYLVIETKKKGRSLKRDCEKLEEFTGSQYGYNVGLLLVFDVIKKRLSNVLSFQCGKEISGSKWLKLRDLESEG